LTTARQDCGDVVLLITRRKGKILANTQASAIVAWPKPFSAQAAAIAQQSADLEAVSGDVQQSVQIGIVFYQISQCALVQRGVKGLQRFGKGAFQQAAPRLRAAATILFHTLCQGNRTFKAAHHLSDIQIGWIAVQL
jgi:hypothetical protein